MEILRTNYNPIQIEIVHVMSSDKGIAGKIYSSDHGVISKQKIQQINIKITEKGSCAQSRKQNLALLVNCLP